MFSGDIIKLNELQSLTDQVNAIWINCHVTASSSSSTQNYFLHAFAALQIESLKQELQGLMGAMDSN